MSGLPAVEHLNDGQLYWTNNHLSHDAGFD
jgi:hypothetical protein